MKQIELVDAFLSGESEGEASSLRIEGCQLIHYQTVIAERWNDYVILNYTRYSLASGRVQKMITDRVLGESLLKVSGIKPDTRETLVNYLNIEQSTFCRPKDALMKVEHFRFGIGYVTSIEKGLMCVVFGNKERSLLYPKVIDEEIVRVLERY